MAINTLIILTLIAVISVSSVLLAREGYYIVMDASINNLSEAKDGVIMILSGVVFFAFSFWALKVGLEIEIIALPLW